MQHYRKTIHTYRKQKVANIGLCPFCLPETLAKCVEQTKLSYVVPNIVSYDLWELHKVIDHLMVIPKRHVTSLSQLTKDEKLDIMNTMAEYEAKGYNAYARAVDSVRRSVPHQHTHLIKTAGPQAKLSFFLQKPYLLLKV